MVARKHVAFVEHSSDVLVGLMKKRRLGLVICAVLLLSVFCGAIPRAMYWGALVHFYLNKRTYETTAQRMLAAKNDVDRQRICGEKCWLLSSDQVAFHYIHGFLNWHDIIYDPRGKILAIKSWDEPALQCLGWWQVFSIRQNHVVQTTKRGCGGNVNHTICIGVRERF